MHEKTIYFGRIAQSFCPVDGGLLINKFRLSWYVSVVHIPVSDSAIVKIQIWDFNSLSRDKCNAAHSFELASTRSNGDRNNSVSYLKAL